MCVNLRPNVSLWCVTPYTFEFFIIGTEFNKLDEGWSSWVGLLLIHIGVQHFAKNHFGISGITIDKIITTMTETPTEIMHIFF